MSTKTGIEWTDATWNPIRGCSRVSEGCRNCYAARVAARFSGPGQAYEGLATLNHRAFNGNPKARLLTMADARWTGEVRFIEEHLADPLHWRKPRRVFVNSMSDLFHDNVKDQWIGRIFGTMAEAHWHTFQVLTKRPERMRDWSEAVAHYPQGDRSRKPIPGWPPNVWLGVSVEDQKTADERIPLLLQTPARRWVSYEPALGPVNFTDMRIMGHSLDALRGEWCANVSGCLVDDKGDGSIDWIVAGGESGPGARPAHPDWFRGVLDQCLAAGVPFFFKQWGEWRPAPPNDAPAYRVGKKKAGRLLDGVEWNEYPEVRA